MRALFHGLAVLGLSLLAARPATADFIDLEDLTFPGSALFVNNPTGASPPPDVLVSSTFTSRGAQFNNVFQRPLFGGVPVDVWAGWSYSRVTDVTTPGLANQFAAYHVPGGGSGAGGSANYAVAFDDTFTPGGRPTVILPVGTRPVSVEITNTTWAALVMRDGDPAGFARRFGPDDFFQLTITGLDDQGAATGSVDFFLAQGRAIVDRWTVVDLTPLGDATQLTFALDSSDFSDFGGVRFLNTPAYFALDNLQVQEAGTVAVPEPATLCLLGIGAGMLLVGRRFAAACRRDAQD
jgi:hypothetical protein